MQINPMSEEFSGGYVKEGIINGTTDPYGNVVVATSLENKVVVIALLNAPYIGYPFVYASGDTYVHVLSTDGLTPVASTAVTGKYYYIDK